MLRHAVAVSLLAVLAACSSASAPKKPSVNGTWSGDVPGALGTSTTLTLAIQAVQVVGADSICGYLAIPNYGREAVWGMYMGGGVSVHATPTAFTFYGSVSGDGHTMSGSGALAGGTFVQMRFTRTGTASGACL